MGKTRHYRPEERTIHRAKPAENKPTKYKHDIFNVDDDDDEYDDSLDDDSESWSTNRENLLYELHQTRRT